MLMQPSHDQFLNMQEVKRALLSRNLKSDYVKDFEDKVAKSSLFLNSLEGEGKILYASYLRSGNTFLRNYLEKVSGVVTGST